jgi:hypothetical protein
VRATSKRRGVTSAIFVATVALVAFWLLLAWSATAVAYGQAGDLDNCERRSEGRVVGVNGSWPTLRHTCVYERDDGSRFEVDDYGMQIAIMIVGAVFGIAGAVALVWGGFALGRAAAGSGSRREHPV